MRTCFGLIQRSVFVTVLFVFTQPMGAGAQELEVSLGRGSSDFTEFGEPWSLAARVRLPVGPLHLIGGHRWSKDGGRRPGTICDSYWPMFEGCVAEGVRYETRLTQWEVGLGVAGAPTNHLELRLSVLAVRSKIDGSSRGAESGRSAGNVYPNPDDPVWARAVTAGLAWRPWLEGRLGLSGTVRHERLDFDACPLDVGAPFCEGNDVTTLELGIVLSR